MELRPIDGPPAVVRTDPAPEFFAIRDDKLLQTHNIRIEIVMIRQVGLSRPSPCRLLLLA